MTLGCPREGGSTRNRPWDSSPFEGLYPVSPSVSSPEPLPQEEEKLPARNANPGAKVCSRPVPVPRLAPGCRRAPGVVFWEPLCSGEPPRA